MALFPAYTPGHYTASINLKSATTTIIAPTKSGMKFVVRAVYLQITAQTGSGSPASLSIGVVGASFPVATIGLGTTAVGQMVEIAQNGTTKPTAQDVGTTGISVTVTAASTYTTQTADVVVEGYYK